MVERRGLIISFPDQSQSFVNGYEVGMLDERMQHGGKAEISMRIQAENVEVVRRMCAAYGWEFSDSACVDEDGLSYDGWRVVDLRKIENFERPKVGLQVVR